MIYRPKDYRNLLHLHLERFEAGDVIGGVPVGVPSVDDYLESLKKGDLGFVLGRPGMLKTGILITLTLNATFVYLNHQDLFCPPIYVTKETTVEDLALKLLSNYSGIDTRVIRTNKVVDWGALHKDVDKMTKELPIIFIGHSIYDESKRKHLDYKLAENEIKQIHDEYGLSSILVAADYLQRFNMNNSEDPRMMYSKMIDMSKEFAMEEKTTWVWGCQAKRDVDARKFPVPQLGDGMDTSNIEHSGDWIVSGMRPIRVEGWNEGDVVPYSKENIIITKDLYYLAVLKQKNGDSGQGFWCSFDPRITSIADR